MEFFKIRRTIPFMRHALVFNVISLITFLAAVFFLAHKGLNFSIEFTGGTLIEVGYKDAGVSVAGDSPEKGGTRNSPPSGVKVRFSRSEQKQPNRPIRVEMGAD